MAGNVRALRLQQRATRVTTDDGSSAEVADGVIFVRDGQGKLVFEYRPGERKTVVHVPDGDLAFAVPQGKVSVEARDGIAWVSERDITMTASGAVRTDANAVETKAQRSLLEAHSVKVVAHAVDTTAERVRQLVGVFETAANRIVERARNVFRDADELSQTRAGRMRVLVKDAFHLLGGRAVLKAKKDVRVDGEKIYLG